jgi:tRNA(His) guanylyltransferase
MDMRKAAEQLRGLQSKDLHEMMHVRGFNLATTPAWQRRGTLVYKKLTEKEGFNPITKETVIVERSAVTAESELPLFTSPEGQEFLKRVLCGN